MRIELTRVGLLVYLANHYTTREREKKKKNQSESVQITRKEKIEKRKKEKKRKKKKKRKNISKFFFVVNLNGSSYKIMLNIFIQKK